MLAEKSRLESPPGCWLHLTEVQGCPRHHNNLGTNSKQQSGLQGKEIIGIKHGAERCLQLLLAPKSAQPEQHRHCPSVVLQQPRCLCSCLHLKFDILAQPGCESGTSNSRICPWCCRAGGVGGNSWGERALQGKTAAWRERNPIINAGM